MVKIMLAAVFLFILPFSLATKDLPEGLTKSGKPCLIVFAWGKGTGNNKTSYIQIEDDFVIRQQIRNNGPLPEGEVYDCYLDVDTEEFKLDSFSRNQKMNGAYTDVAKFYSRNATSTGYSTITYTTTCVPEESGTYRCSTYSEMPRNCSTSCDLIILIIFFLFFALAFFLTFTLCLICCIVNDDKKEEKKALTNYESNISHNITLKNIVEV